MGTSAEETKREPRGTLEAMRPRVRDLGGWDSSASGLFDWLRARMSSSAIAAIAAADYGTGANENAAALREIVATGLVPTRLPARSHEVLSLTRWSSGDDTDHVARAFACVLLATIGTDDDELATIGVVLVESVLTLGDEGHHHAEHFFAWRSQTEDGIPSPGGGRVDAVEPDDVGPEHVIALLLLFILRIASAPQDPRLDALASMLTRHPAYPLATVAEWMTDSQTGERFTRLVDRVLVPRASTHPAASHVLRGLRQRR